MPKSNEAISLRLEKRQDGTLVLRNALSQTDPATATEPIVWPKMHEFSQDWLLENMAVLDMDSNEIRLYLANASATYKIRRDLMQQTLPITDDSLVKVFGANGTPNREANAKEFAKVVGKKPGEQHTFQLATGYWGELTESDVWTPEPVDPRAYEVREAHDAGRAGHEGLSGECDACNAVRRDIAKEQASG